MRDALSEAEKRFWCAFDAAIADDGSPTPVKISEATREVIGREVSEGTIKGWLTDQGDSPRRLPRFERDLLTVIKALGAEKECDWLSLLRAAKKGRDTRKGGGHQAVEPDHAAREERPADLSGDNSKTTTRDKKQRSVTLVRVAIVTVLAVVVVGLTTRASDDNPPSATPQDEEQQTASPQVCADVVKSVAHVFPKPGAEPYAKIAKYKGDQMVLYLDAPDTTGPDGRRYRAIRSPARADPGKSHYSWMRAGDIANAPCNAPRRQQR